MARDNVDLTALGTFIRQHRSRLNLTQTQLAESLGWTQERISVLESGKYGVPSVPALVRLADALDVSALQMVEVLGYSIDGPGSGSTGNGSGANSAALQYTLQQLLGIQAITLKDALDEASDQMAAAMGADKIDAFVYDPPSNSLVALGTSNTPMGRLQLQSGLNRIPLANQERTAQVYETGKIFRTGDAQNDPQISIGVKETLGVQSILAVPLRVDRSILGVLVAESAQRDRFSSDEERFFVAASHWVGMIANRARVAEVTREASAEQARRDAADEVITTVAHELGNLLTPLKGRLDILQRRLLMEGNERDLEHAEQAIRSVTSIQRLVSRLLDVARLDHGLYALTLQPVDMSHLVEDVANEMRPIWENLVVRAGDVPEVEADRIRLHEVLVNLVTNAIQHSPRGTPIILGTGLERRDDGKWVVVNVTDEGPGIAPNQLPLLFQRFRGGGGTHSMGLGLYLSKRLVDEHGGTLTVQSAVERGTTFWLSLPVRK